MAPSALLDHKLNVPATETADQAAEAVDILERFLRDRPTTGGPTDALTVKLVTDGNDATITLPADALRLLVDVLAQIANGNAVTVAPVHAELTTQQAADLLNVSRPYFVKLLEEGEIPYRRVGNRRRVMLSDLITYKRIDDAKRDVIADQLTAEAQRLGLDY